MKGSYFYLIEVQPQSPLDMDIQRLISVVVYGSDKRGYRDYFRVTAESIPEALGRILVNERLLMQLQTNLIETGEAK